MNSSILSASLLRAAHCRYIVSALRARGPRFQPPAMSEGPAIRTMAHSPPTLRAGVLLALRSVLGHRACGGSIVFDVSFDDPGSTYSAYYSELQNTAQAAVDDWAQYFATPGTVTVDLTIDLTNSVPRSAGSSNSSTYLQTVNGIDIYEQSVATQVRTGIDPNGSASDATIYMSPDYMTNNLWFDPDPFARTAPVPSDRTDADSVFIHELGHVFGFNGWKSGTDGTLPGNYESTWDKYETFDGTNLWFNGPNAVKVYGGPVPATYGDNFHVGNPAPRPGSDLIPDLMNGVVFYYGTRYDISPLDLAIMKDVGLPVQLPGDVNGDGIVNGLDISLVASHWLQTGSGVAGDANGDGIVNGLDIADIASHWLLNDGGGSGAASVPEPSTIVPAGLGGLLLLVCNRLGIASARWQHKFVGVLASLAAWERPAHC